MKVEEYTTYQFDSATSSTIADSRVKFSSGFNMGIKSKVEDWSRTKFDENVKKSRMGMAFVIQKLEEARNPQFWCSHLKIFKDITMGERNWEN